MTDLRSAANPSTGWRNTTARVVFASAAGVTILTTAAIILVLLTGAIDFFRAVSVIEYLTTFEWAPQSGEPAFGVWPLVWGTLMITVGAGIVAIPVGTLAAVYLSEYAPPRVRGVLKPVLEILAGVPTIVYGFFALSFVTPVVVRPLAEAVGADVGTFNAAAGAIVVGVMIIPMVSSLSEDAMSSVPDELRQAAYGLGATKYEVSTQVVVPASVSGIVAAYVLALSRAIGETMAVTLAAGMRPQIATNPFAEIQTMTAYMVKVGTGDVSVGSIGYQSLFAVGLTLFVMTFAMNLASLWIKSRYREEYQ